MGSCAGTSFDIVVTVDPEPVYTGPILATVCSDDATGVILPAGDDDGLAITSYDVAAVVGSGLTGSATTATGTADVNLIINDVFTNLTNAAIDVTYTVTPYNNACEGTSFDIVVTVSPEPVYTGTLDATVCSDGATGVVLPGTDDDGGLITSYDVTAVVGGTLTGVATTAIGTTDINLIAGDVFTNITNTTDIVTYTVTPYMGSCVGTSFDIVVTVSPEPLYTGNLNATVCSDGATGVVLPSTDDDGGVITSFDVTAVAGAGLTGTATTGTGISNVNLIAGDVFTNLTNASDIVTYTVTPYMGSCAGTSFDIVVTVDPEPVYTGPILATVCSDEVTGVLLPATDDDGGPITSYNVMATVGSGLTGAASTAVGTTDVNLISSDIFNNITNTPIDVTYIVTPYNNSCVGTTFNIVVTVNPETVISASDQIICSDETTNIVINNDNNVSGSTFSWVIASSTNVSGATGGSGSIIAETLSSTDGINPGYIDYTITPSANGCLGDPYIVSVKVNPLPTVSVEPDYAVCEPEIIDLTGTFGGGATSGLWQVVIGNGSLSASSVTGNTVTAIYTPDITDVNTVIVLRLETNDPDGPTEPCTTTFADISITIDESAKVEAGDNQEICEDVSALLNGSISGSVSTGTWTIVSGGDGTFDNGNSPITNYNPGTNDRANAPTTVTLRLTSDAPGTTCGVVYDETEVLINELPEVHLFGLDPYTFQEDEPPVQLIGFPTEGGTGVFSGQGVIGDKFYPSVANLVPAANTVVYTFTLSETGCTNFEAWNVTVNPVTDIEFTIETATVPPIPGDTLQICSNSGKLAFIGSPPLSSGIAPSFFSSTIPTMDDKIIGELLDTDGLPSGTYDVTYTYTNDYGATSYRTRFIKVYASPAVAFDIGNFCIDSPIVFTDQSTMEATPYVDSVLEWSWTFGDGTVSSDQNPMHTYAHEGTYDIGLLATSEHGCTGSLTESAVFGAVPTVDYVISEFCTNDITLFQASVDFGDQIPSDIIDYTWDFGDGIINSSGSADNTSHLYASGTYSTLLTITTLQLCQASDMLNISILPQETVEFDSLYSEGFEAVDNGWFEGTAIENDSNSWVWGPPNGNIINSASEGNNAWWTGGNADPIDYYYNGEESFVDGPCFDLTNLSRPMVSLDTWDDTQEGFDGAVLQYSTNGGIDWVAVGRVDEGVNWYNTTNILGKPGGADNGWSKHTEGWVTSRFSLEQIPLVDRGQVRLRVAFGSNEDNPIADTLNGFAFDNVTIRDRNRVVLIENFTSLVNPDYTQVSSDIMGVQAQIPNDFIYLNYHVPYPQDTLYRDNKAEPQTRANTFGFSQTINTAIDGNVYVDAALAWDKVDIDKRSLVDPQFSIDLDTLPTSADSLSILWNVKTVTQVDNPIIVHTIVIEKEVVNQDLGTVAYNVVKKMLPNAAGSSNPNKIVYYAGDEYSVGQIDWKIDRKLYAADQLAVVVFVQEKTDGSRPGEIYQTAYIDIANDKTTSFVTGIDDELLESIARSIDVYPNPVENELYFTTRQSPGEMFNWKIIDQRGVTLANDGFSFVNGEYVVDTSEIPNGIYYLVIGAADQPLTYEKIIIMHR
ncbi:MAG: PKD-like domain-containing protein, partial [Bacteroidota bacterium]